MCRKMIYLISLLILGLTVHNVYGQSSVKVNFQSATQGSREVPEGYLPDYGDVFGDRGNGWSYGWTVDKTASSRDRDIDPDQRYDTHNSLNMWNTGMGNWEIELPNATYDIYIVGGDPGYLDSTQSYIVEGVTVEDPTPYPPGNTTGSKFDECTVTVAVNDGRLTIEPVSGVGYVKICFVHIVDIRVSLPVSPANDSSWSSTSVVLEWLAGVGAIQHDVYFGEDFNDVSEATTSTPDIYKGRQSELVYPVTGTLEVEPGKTYYWRIDEYDGTNVIKGGISKFTVQVVTAFAPDPVDGGLFVDPNTSLSWSKGAGAIAHHVYFGDNLESVRDADTSSPEYKGMKIGSTTTWDPPDTLELNKTYYWRIDEQTSGSVINQGDVWSFTTASRAEVGLKAQYYDNIELSGEPVLTRVDPQINFDWGTDSPEPNVVPEDGFSVRWSGAIDIPASGQWTFWTHTDDSVRLWVNGQLIVDVWGSSRPLTWDSSPITLSAGTYPIVMEYFEAEITGHIAIAQLNWEGPAVPVRQIIPAGAFQQPLWAMPVSLGNGAVDVGHTPTLQWTSGDKALEHDIYVSTDYNDIANADITTPDVYRGRQALDQTTYTVPEAPLDLSRTYYWRIDEVNGTDMWVGSIWSFTTAGFLLVDDFESYNDITSGQQGSKLVYETWTDGYDNPSVNGSAIGYVSGASMETAIVHGGSQSVPLSYNNSTASYSEVTVGTSYLDVGSDWTRGDVKVMTLWFYGDPNNAVTEQLYVKIDGVKVLYDGENADVAISRWAQWNIELGSLGLNLNNVSTLAIGLERTGATGGSGTLLIDDIRLYKTPPPKVEALISHYGFEYNADDDSGNGYHGTINGNPTFVQSLTGYGAALQFDGVDDFVEVPDSDAITFAASDSYTISAWAYVPDISGTWRGIAFKGRESGGSANYYGICIGSNGGVATWYYGPWPTWGSAIPEPGWYHAAVVQNGAAGTKQLYINGALDSSITAQAADAAGSLIIGASFQTGEFFNGIVDEVRLYNIALSEAEVLFLAGQ
jgi:hypothetical protein